MARPTKPIIGATTLVALVVALFSASVQAHTFAGARTRAGRTHSAVPIAHAASRSTARTFATRAPGSARASKPCRCSDGQGLCGDGTAYLQVALDASLLPDARRAVFVPAAIGPPPPSVFVRVLLRPPVVL